jgi:hypothetical protein
MAKIVNLPFFKNHGPNAKQTLFMAQIPSNYCLWVQITNSHCFQNYGPNTKQQLFMAQLPSNHCL